MYPTISSGQQTKVVIVSTPNGMNLFYKLWSDAESGKNSYNPIEVRWSEIPDVMQNGNKKLLQILHKNNLIVSLSVSS